MSHTHLLLLLFLIPFSCWANLLIQYSNETLSVDIYSWSNEEIQSFKNNSFPLIFANQDDQFNITEPACVVLYPRIAGASSNQRPYSRELILRLKNEHIIGVIIPTNYADNWFSTFADILDTPFPVGLISLNLNTFQKLRSVALEDPTSVIGTFSGWNRDRFWVWRYVSLVLNFIWLFLNFACMCWALYKLYYIRRAGQIGLNIGTVCLSMEVLCCLLRLMMFVFGIPAYFDAYNLPYAAFSARFALQYFAYPFTLSSGIFLVFFWIDVTSPTLYRGNFLDKAFYPSVALVVLAFLLVDVTIIIWLVGKTTQTFVSITGGVVLLFSLIVAIIYFFAAHRIRKYIKDRASRATELNKMTNKVLLSGAVIVIIVLVCLALLGLVGTGSLAYNVLGELLSLLFIMRSWLQIEVFSTPKSPETKSSDNSPIGGDSTGDSSSIALQTNSAK